MFKKGISLLQKLRNLPNTVKVLGTVAVFSPTFVACYGMPSDDPHYRPGCEQHYDCIDGYITMCDNIVEVNKNDKPHICAMDSSGEYHLGECTVNGIEFTSANCTSEERDKIFYPD